MSLVGRAGGTFNYPHEIAMDAEGTIAVIVSRYHLGCASPDPLLVAVLFFAGELWALPH